MRFSRSTSLIVAITLTGFLLSGCGGESAESDTANNAAAAEEPGLTPDQIEKGIGPITNITLGEIDAALAESGGKIFTMKCAACHKMDDRYVGPPLADVTQQRTPEFIMNMMLNPDQMIKEHPVGKELFASYMTPMPNQNMTEQEAREVLEYLRTKAPSTN